MIDRTRWLALCTFVAASYTSCASGPSSISANTPAAPVHNTVPPAAAAQPVLCPQPNVDVLERKIDDLAKELAAIKSLISQGGGHVGGVPSAMPKRPTADPAKTYAIAVAGLPFEGPADAKVTIVKAYEYGCPYCEKNRATLEDIVQKYGNDVKIVYSQFVVHPQIATSTALAACAAHKQGRFAVMDTALWEKVFKPRAFDTQPTNGSGATQCWDTPAGCPTVVGLATDLGLNLDKFKADMRGDCQAEIQKQQQDMQLMGVSATPGFFINGRFLSGAQPIETFSALIDEELKKANERITAGTRKSEYYKHWVLAAGEKNAEIP